MMLVYGHGVDDIGRIITQMLVDFAHVWQQITVVPQFN